MKKIWKLLPAPLMVALLLALLVGRGKAALPLKQQALVGLTGVHVVVSSLSKEAEDIGLSREQLLTAVELRLRQSGVTILSEEEVGKVPGIPVLYLSVSVMSSGVNGIGFFSLGLNVNEFASLHRDSSSLIAVKTWSSDALGRGKKDFIRSAADDLVDKFLNDYLAANPKK